MKIDLAMNKERLKKVVQRAKERNIIIPTFAQQKNPELIPETYKRELANVGLWDITARNLFRITWKKRAEGKRGWVWEGKLPGITQEPDGCRCTDHCPGGEMVSDRSA